MKVRMLVLSVCASAAMTGFADGDFRRLIWTNPATGNFEDAANWTWGGAEVQAGPDWSDNARFYMESGTAETVVRLNADTCVSNFQYYADGQKTDFDMTFDLNGHVLTVSNNMDVSTRSYAPNSMLTIKNGEIDVVGTADGTTTYGQPNEDAGGLYFNRSGSQQTMANVILDNAKLIVPTLKNFMVQFYGLQGNTGTITLKNGSVLDVPVLDLLGSGGGCKFVATGAGTCVCATNTVATPKGMVLLEPGGSGGYAWDVRFENGASLRANGLYMMHNTTCTFDGGTHKLTGVNNYGNHAAITVGATSHIATTNALLVVTNNAVVEITHKLLFSGPSTVKVCDGGKLYCSVSNFEMVFGYNSGNSVLEVDNGTVDAPWLKFGASSSARQNTHLYVKGPLSYVKANQQKEWGYNSGFKFTAGATMHFDIPSEGYHTTEGVARAPVYSAGWLLDTSPTEGNPIKLSLKTRAFDRVHPQESVTLIQCHDASKEALETLAANVTFVDSARNPGVVSVSADNKSLVYTAPPAKGLMLILR